MIPLHRAREAGDAAGLPIMVHPQGAWCESIDDVLAVMKGGDIVTHCFHGSTCGILDDEGHDMKQKLQVGDRFYTPHEFIEESMRYRAVYTPTGLKNP
jgi:dihydroorotase